jgi:hypothetical protein
MLNRANSLEKFRPVLEEFERVFDKNQELRFVPHYMGEDKGKPYNISLDRNRQGFCVVIDNTSCGGGIRVNLQEDFEYIQNFPVGHERYPYNNKWVLMRSHYNDKNEHSYLYFPYKEGVKKVAERVLEVIHSHFCTGKNGKSLTKKICQFSHSNNKDGG